VRSRKLLTLDAARLAAEAGREMRRVLARISETKVSFRGN